MRSTFRHTFMAGLIPAFSFQKHGFDYEFSIDQLLSKKITPLDIALYTCSVIKCDYVIIVAAPEQIPILKMKYGDSFYNLLEMEISDSDWKVENAKPMGIFYVSPAERYKKFSSYPFNLVHIANIFRKGLDEAFSILGPSMYFVCLPWIVVNPQYLMENTEQFLEHRKKCAQDKLDLQMQDENGQLLPGTSHRLVKTRYMMNAWEKLKKNYDFKSPGPILKLNLEDLLDPAPKPSGFSIPNDKWYDISKWHENMRIMNDLNNLPENERSIVGDQMLRLHANVRHLPKLVHFEELRVLNSLKFMDVEIQRDFHRDYQTWKKKRLRRIGLKNE